jgi:outer membrane protein assembly factor BamB
MDGTLYCANSRGLTALSPEGVSLWRYETRDKYCHAALNGEKVVLSTYSGEVYCLDAGDLSRRARQAIDSPAPPVQIEVANGFVTVGGVRLKQRGNTR